MRKHLYDDEHNKHLSQHTPGMKRQEHSSFYIRDNKLVKSTIIRTYFNNGDYVDSRTSEIICNTAE